MIASEIFDYYNLAFIVIRKNTFPRMGYDMEKFIHEITDLAKTIAADCTISAQQKLCIFDIAQKILSASRNEIEKKSKPQLPNIDDNYPRYPGPHEDALEWLETHWGRYLKHFRADEDYLFQYQLHELDKKLLSTLIDNTKYRKKLQSKGLKLNDIIPRKSERTTKTINSIYSNEDQPTTMKACVANYQRRLRSPKP